VSIERLADILLGRQVFSRVAEQGHPVPGTTSLDVKNVGFRVANVAAQLVADWPLAVEAPAPQSFEAELSSLSKVPFRDHGDMHLLRHRKCPDDNCVRRRSQAL
jgi:hypothetical protein